MASVFISYVEADGEIARLIAASLEGAGFSTWYYERDSVPGVSYLLQTSEAIQLAKAVLLLISSRSLSQPLQVTREVVRAHESGKYFLPVLVDVTHDEFQKLQPEWRQAIGSATSVSVLQRGMEGACQALQRGLLRLGLAGAPTASSTINKDFPLSGTSPVRTQANSAKPATESKAPSDLALSLPQTSTLKKSAAGTLSFAELKDRSTHMLNKAAKDMGITAASGLSKPRLIFKILQTQAEKNGFIFSEGVLECLPGGFGFLRTPEYNYLTSPDDVYVSPSQIRRFDLRTGDTISGQVRPPKEPERRFVLIKVDAINFEPPEEAQQRLSFDALTPIYPAELLKLETVADNYAGRVLDLLTPIGKGQRGLIIGPPSSGKTTLLQIIANSLASNCRELTQLILTVEGRPEEVVRMQRSAQCEVIRSTASAPAAEHVNVAEMVLEKGKRLLEYKRNVVILLDSITRLAGAYGTDANALRSIKRFFETARNVEEGGSLTIIAAASVDTGARMEQAILEELKGTANMELQLDRELAEKGVFPAVNIKKSGTRNVELLWSNNHLKKISTLRRVLGPLSALESTELLLDTLRRSRSNAEFLDAITE